jgi:hypothetical protein
MGTIMEKLKEMFEYPVKGLGGNPENINCDQQFNVPEFTYYFTKKGTNIYFSQPDHPHKNAIIERFCITLALLLQRMREGIKSFDWTKSLPDVVDNLLQQHLPQNTESKTNIYIERDQGKSN